MEMCVYCEQPLAETERVRWYSECVHPACYEELLANELAVLVMERRADQRQEDSLSDQQVISSLV
jgi:hypothetical protein